MQERTTHSIHSSAQNTLHLGQVQLDTRYDQSRTDGVTGGAKDGNLSTTWPDVRVNWGNLEKLLPLSRLASNLTATSNLSRQVREQSTDRKDAAGEAAPDTRVETSSWQPLFSVSGDLKNRDHFTISADKSSSTTSNFRMGGGSTDASRALHVNLKHTIKAPVRPASKTGSDLGFQLRSDIDINFDGSLQNQDHTDFVVSGPEPDPKNSKRLDLSATGTYTFANNVRGSLLAGYTRNYTSQQDLTTHSIRLQATASLNF